jgi:hypothetical protein
MNTPTTSKKAIKQNSLSTAAFAVNSKMPKSVQGEIDMADNRARIVLPSGAPVSIHTMMDIASTCLTWGCTSYVQNMVTRDCLAIVFYYDNDK